MVVMNSPLVRLPCDSEDSGILFAPGLVRKYVIPGSCTIDRPVRSTGQLHIAACHLGTWDIIPGSLAPQYHSVEGLIFWGGVALLGGSSQLVSG